MFDRYVVEFILCQVINNHFAFLCLHVCQMCICVCVFRRNQYQSFFDVKSIVWNLETDVSNNEELIYSLSILSHSDFCCNMNIELLSQVFNMFCSTLARCFIMLPKFALFHFQVADANRFAVKSYLCRRNVVVYTVICSYIQLMQMFLFSVYQRSDLSCRQR